MIALHKIQGCEVNVRKNKIIKNSYINVSFTLKPE